MANLIQDRLLTAVDMANQASWARKFDQEGKEEQYRQQQKQAEERAYNQQFQNQFIANNAQQSNFQAQQNFNPYGEGGGFEVSYYSLINCMSFSVNFVYAIQALDSKVLVSNFAYISYLLAVLISSKAIN